MGTPIQALVGVINGSNVIGSSIDMSLTEAAKWSKGYDDVVNSKTWRVLQTAMSLYFMIDIGVQFGEWIAKKCSKGESPSADEAAKAQSDIKDQAQEKLENSGNDDQLKTGDAVVEEQIDVEPVVWNTEIIKSEAEEIDHQFEEENVQTELGENSDIINEEINQSDLEAKELSEVNPESDDANEKLQDIQDQISSNQAEINKLNVSSDNATDKEVEQDEEQESEDEDEEEKDEEEENEDEDGDSDDGNDGDGDGDDIPDMEV
jgi:hypothetical protein